MITGASGGIGRSLALRFAEEGHGLVIVSRSRESLEDLKRKIQDTYGLPVTVAAADLTVEGAAERLYEELSSKGIEIEYLVNNAGFGDFGDFCDRPWSKYEAMMRLNIFAAAELTHIYAADMLRRGGGRIMNVASMVAFQAGPRWSMYTATKSFILSLTESLSIEYRNTGVTFTALCPGPTSTGFEAAAESEESRMFSRIGSMDPETVADKGYRCMMKGKTVCVPGAKNKILVFMSKILPRSVSGGFFAKIQ